MLLIGMLLMTGDAGKLIGETLAPSLGSGLIATGIAGLVLYLYVRSTDTLQETLRSVTAAGIVSVFEHRSVRIRSEYDQRLTKPRRIDLIGFGLSALREDYARNFNQWAQTAHVRILLMDPDFPSRSSSLCDLRDIEENCPKGEIRQQVQAFEREVAAQKLNPAKFEVRRMKTIPAINLFRIDNEIFWGPYLMKEQSRNTPTILVRRGGYMFDVLSAHFEETWNASA